MAVRSEPMRSRRRGSPRSRVPWLRRVDRRALGCLLVTGALLAGGLTLLLAHASPRRTGTNGIGAEQVLATLNPGSRLCQGGELLPSGTTTIRLLVPAQQAPGPVLRIVLSRGGRVLARTTGVAGLGGVADYAVVAPIPRTTRDLDDVRLCFTVGTGAGEAAAIGSYTPPGTGQATVDGSETGGSIPVDYLRPGAESWWSVASAVVRRIGLGRGSAGGAWTAWLALVLVLASLVLATRAVVRTVLLDPPPRVAAPIDDATPWRRMRLALRRMPAIGWTVAAIGVANALAWALITPAFQVPDEQTHVAYVQQIAETGRPPAKRGTAVLAPELTATMQAVRYGEYVARRFVPALWSPLQQRQLERVLHAGLSRRGNGDAGPADPEPPLYYALEAIPYRLAAGATLLDRLSLMRAASALLAGATALLVLLFVRECLPGRPWAWTVGGVGAAFVPLLGFVSGGVNPDALLFPICAALFVCIARAFHRGMTTRRAVSIGIVLGVGMVAKINFYGLVPGALVAVAVSARASAGAWNAWVARQVGTVVAIGAAPYLAMSLLDALVWERAFILARTPGSSQGYQGDLGGQLSFLWQVFLPRLPGQTPLFPGISPPYNLWIEGFIGRFGWVTVELPGWAYAFGASVLAVLGLLAVRTLVLARKAVRRRWAELAAYALMTGGLLLLIGVVALRGWAPGIKGAVQGRYLLPLLALFAALLVLAARGAGERWGRAAGVAIVAFAIAWSLLGQLATIAYFYS